jgi:hypothetical protein
VSPLIFGTNLALFNSKDQVLTSQATRACLQRMHISIIRLPIRSGLDSTTIQTAVQTVKQLGAVPLVVLHGAMDRNALQDDIAIINTVNGIFGNSTVYYEYGNNEDILQVSAKMYTDSWNANVGVLKRLAPNGSFIGPVTYEYRADYLRYFLQHAQPRPDAVSWHAYACSRTWSNNRCLASLSDWAKHVQEGRALIKSTLHTTLPIMITEWNYAPDTVQNDGKNNDSAFMTTWTTRALQTLAASGVFAAIQYAATNTNINLIDATNTLTAQGTVMQKQYETLVPSSSSASTPDSTATATVTPVSDASGAVPPPHATIPPSSSCISEPE